MTNIQVCDIVLYSFSGDKPSKWRVTHHLRRIEESPPVSSGWAIVDKIIAEEREKERQERLSRGLPANRRYRLQYCTQEEATHVALVAVCGAHAPIEQCERVGVVEWDAAYIEEQRKDAVRPFWLGKQTDWRWE
jgi:hypothetical protein